MSMKPAARSILLLALLPLAAGCGRRSLMVLELNTNQELPEMRSVSIRAANAERRFSVSLPVEGQAAMALGVYLPAGVSGPTAVTVSARDEQDCEVGSARGTVNVAAGQTSTTRMVVIANPLACQPKPTLVSGLTDAGGLATIGSGTDAAELLVIDGENNRPVVGAFFEAIAVGQTYLARVYQDAEAFEPELVTVGRGQQATVTLRAQTADLRARTLSLAPRLFDEDRIGQFDLDGVATEAASLGATSVLFAPALEDVAGTAFDLYRLPISRTLVAVASGGALPEGAAPKGQSRAVALAGAARAGLKVQGRSLAGSASVPTAQKKAPQVTAARTGTPDAGGQTKVEWDSSDPEQRLLGFDVGLDTTAPAKRVAKDAGSLTLAVKRGRHFACVRPVFDGAEAEAPVRCVTFDAAAAPPAPDLKVKVHLPDAAGSRKAKVPFDAEIEIENAGDSDAPAFDLEVTISRDGRLEGGAGEVRTLHVDGVKAQSKLTRTTRLQASRDGAFFVVAEADRRRRLEEANPEDNRGRAGLIAEPAGNNHSPVLSLTGTAASGGRVELATGAPLSLQALAQDPEEGDLSERIVWRSSIDGELGRGPSLTVGKLSAGRHRIVAEVQDTGVSPIRLPETDYVGAAEADGDQVQVVDASFEVEVVDPTAAGGEAPNSPPVVSAGPNRTGTVGMSIAFAGSAFDPDGNPLTLSWTVAGPAGSLATLAAAGTLAPSLVPDVPGLYRLTLGANDGQTETRDDTAMLALPATANRSPTVTLDLPKAATAGSTLLATANATDPDAGDAVTLSYDLLRPAGSRALLAGADTAQPSFVADVAGSYVLTVFAEDGRGGLATASASVEVATAAPDGGVGQDAGVPGGVGSACSTGSECASPLRCCTGKCVAVDHDQMNCGACDRACAADQTCSAGQCATTARDGGVDADAGPATIVGLNISPASYTLAVGASFAFRATATWSDGTNTDVTMNAMWMSSNVTVATVSNTAPSYGMVYGIAPGMTTIQASYAGISSANAMVTVTPAAQCGNGTCEAAEACSTCPQDCGACPPLCGDAVCGGTETCNSCPQDCGACRADGQTCTSAGVCASGFCVDGVCCDSACGGGAADCQACSVALGASVDGVCTLAMSGLTCRAAAGPCDRVEYCTGSSATCPADGYQGTSTVCRAAAGPCDAPEMCNGVSINCPTDYLKTAGTPCGTESCLGNIYTPAPVCDGAGVCSTPTSTSCSPYACGATTCKTTCSTGLDCDAGHTCNAPVCQ